jgi:hypothetical protein
MAQDPSTTGSRWAVITVICGSVGVGALVLFFFDPSQYGFYPGCTFHKTTGLLCAGCGATRAVYQLLHGHVGLALRFNPLIVISLPLLAWYGIRKLRRALKNEPCTVRFRPGWLYALFAVLILFTVVRNLPGLPESMRPPEGAATPGLQTKGQSLTSGEVGRR